MEKDVLHPWDPQGMDPCIPGTLSHTQGGLWDSQQGDPAGTLAVGLNAHPQSTEPRDLTDPQPSPALPRPLTQVFMWETET